MIRILSFALLLSCSTHGQSQRRFDHELQLTETRFALESQIHGLNWGFIYNMHKGALGLNRQGFNNLYDIWMARPATPDFVLLWKPSVGFWSSDGRFGITSGPSYTKATDSALRHTGYFFSIWTRALLSEPFKISLDIGVSLPGPVITELTMGSDVRLHPIVQKNTYRKLVEESVNSKTILPGFRNLASGQSIAACLNAYADNKTHILVSGHSALQKQDAGKTSRLAGKFQFNKTDAVTLGPSCYYEWGTLNKAENANTEAISGYFVHVWSLETGKPVLLAALYRFE